MIEKLKMLVKQQEAIEPLKDKEVIDKEYRYWRFRVMYSMLVGYAVFYFVRKNMSVANPILEKEFGLTGTEMGWILTTGTIIYAVSKFANGVLSDRFSPRFLMSFGLMASAIVSIFFGMSSILPLFIILWGLNSLFQGMGMPPCSRLITQWYSPSELGEKWGIWNASHQIGTAVIISGGGLLMAMTNYNWRYMFFVPAVFAIVVSIFLMNRLRDNPESKGLPPIEVYRDDITLEEDKEVFEGQDRETGMDIFKKYILNNKLVWIVSIANLFIYVVRIGVVDWFPNFLQNAHNYSVKGSGFVTAIFEISGIVGALVGGKLSDTVFKGKRARVSVIFMVMLVFSVYGLMLVPKGNVPLMLIALGCVGFFVYGPMLLIAVAAADFATKKAAATAVGLTGLFGYIGAAISGVGIGYTKQHYGWEAVLYIFLISAAIGTFLLAFTWNKRSEILDAHHE
jgi:phosphoglycerate transporter family protein